MLLVEALKRFRTKILDLCMHLFTKVCGLLMLAWEAFQVSHPYNRTDLTLELNGLSLVLSEISLVFQILHSEVNAACAFPILDLISVEHASKITELVDFFDRLPF